jgi:NAD-dependent dihydropyrimidine dehydrogenase PreA subunit
MNYLKGVATLRLDRDKCNGCGMCQIVCPHGVFLLEDRRAWIRDLDACMECGACAKNCAQGALAVEAGVGCAYAFINAALGRTDSACCGATAGKSSGCC